MSKTRLALFASGNGSNALNIIDHFSGHPSVEIAFVLSNKIDAPIIASSKAKNVMAVYCTNDQVSDGEYLISLCKENAVNYIVLAGYLRLIPKELIHFFNDRIFNIHPSLLPKYGGHGMYGDFVHQAVINSQETESGISIHFIDECFDRGRMIAQFYCSVEQADTLESLKRKIQFLEHSYFPIVIEKTIISLSHV